MFVQQIDYSHPLEFINIKYGVGIEEPYKYKKYRHNTRLYLSLK